MVSWLIAPALPGRDHGLSSRLVMPFVLKSVFNSISTSPSVTASGTSSVEFHQ